jgi:5-(carboxyamino)imidazole ribonucleotide mutase
MVDIGVLMGSQSDWHIMKKGCAFLDDFGVSYEKKIISAHRTPERLYDYARSAKDNGIKVIIAGAGGAAHLPGMAAALTPLPVLGVPIESKSLKGMDSLLSIVQMPKGVPVACVAINGSENAALLAVQILCVHDHALSQKLALWRMGQSGSIALSPEE